MRSMYLHHDLYFKFKDDSSARRLQAVWQNQPVKELAYAYNDPRADTRVPTFTEVLAYLRHLKAKGVEPSATK